MLRAVPCLRCCEIAALLSLLALSVASLLLWPTWGPKAVQCTTSANNHAVLVLSVATLLLRLTCGLRVTRCIATAQITQCSSPLSDSPDPMVVSHRSSSGGLPWAPFFAASVPPSDAPL